MLVGGLVVVQGNAETSVERLAHSGPWRSPAYPGLAPRVENRIPSLSIKMSNSLDSNEIHRTLGGSQRIQVQR
jgi:hypothetical protein